MSIETKFNFDDVFFRDLSIAVKKNCQDKIKWVNKFQDKPRNVTVPFYYSLAGDDRFLFDTFTDDIAGKRLELNTDVIPRAHFMLKSFSVKSDEFCNPNVWLRMVIEDNTTSSLKSILSKIRAIPIVATYDYTILLDNELDALRCNESILSALWMNKYVNFEYNFLKIDAMIMVPDNTDVTINRDVTLSNTDARIQMKFSTEVHTYYPAYVDYIPAQGVVWKGNISTDNNTDQV